MELDPAVEDLESPPPLTLRGRIEIGVLSDEVIDRVWNTFAAEGWDDPRLRAQRFQQFGTSNVPCLWGLRAAVRFANEIGLDRIERRHRELANYLLDELVRRVATSWTWPMTK